MSDEKDSKSKHSTDKKASGASVVKAKAGGKKHAVLNNKINIFYDKPLPDYDRGVVKAYAAKETGGMKANCYALVCEKSLFPRLRQAISYIRISNPHVMKLIDHGVVYWAADDAERYVFVYETGREKRFVDETDSVALGMNLLHVRDAIVPFLSKVLSDFEDKKFCHGSLCLSNIYGIYDSGVLSSLLVGDALSLPYAHAQSALYLSPEKALADPVARGAGTFADDIYAFGVCLALLLRKNDPLDGKSHDEIIREKVRIGSYAALTGKDRFTGAMLELLRGVLSDNVEQRWTAIDIAAWVEGKRLSPKQPLKAKTASRPLVFGEKKYTQAVPLALDIPSHATIAVQMLENDEVITWLSRSLEDKEASKRFQVIAEKLGSERTRDYEARAVSYMLMALHPNAPLVYKNLSVFPSNLGRSLLCAMDGQEDLRPFTDIFSGDLALNWLAMQSRSDGFSTSLEGLLAACKAYLKKMKVGFGLERTLYSLLPEAYCMSPRLKKYLVYTPKDLLTAFEEKLGVSKVDGHLIDRHIAAFLMERETRVIEVYLYELNSGDESKVTLANLRCFGRIQARFKMKALPNIAKSFLPQLNFFYKRLHDRKKREQFKEKITKAAERGDLNEMIGLLGDDVLMTADHNRFVRAMEKHRGLQLEYDKNADNLNDQDKFNRNFGHNIAAMVSLGGAALLILMGMAGHFIG